MSNYLERRVDPERVYSIGASITLYERSATEHEITIEIIKHFRVRDFQKSQTVLAKLQRGTLGIEATSLHEQSVVVAKFYDSRYAEIEAPHIPTAQSCRWSMDNEIHAYDTLKEYQGVLVPVFYGEFTFTSNEVIIPVLIISYINYRMLAEYYPFNFTTVEVDRIVACLEDVVKKFHEKGVYHRDLELHNVLYNRETAELMVIDFGRSVSAGYRGAITEGRFKDVLKESERQDLAMIQVANSELRSIEGGTIESRTSLWPAVQN